MPSDSTCCPWEVMTYSNCLVVEAFMRDSRAETLESSYTSGCKKMTTSLQNFFFSGSQGPFLDNSWRIRKGCLKPSFDGIL